MICPLGSTFFGLTLSYRSSIFLQIHEIVYHGNGGYDWGTVYNMPIWLRNYTFNSIQEYHNKQQEEYEKSNTPQQRSTKDIFGPDISPSYSTKASR